MRDNGPRAEYHRELVFSNSGGISCSLLMAHFLFRNIGSFVVLHWHYTRHLYTWDTLNIIVYWVTCHFFGVDVREGRRRLHTACPDALNR
ncbi:hypothetical protein ARMGADRAFT_588126 [Armillaria gallica]|uniref:Uncharacterized protein n=1 Tax=Armillaria gallica TaxID=47427 RepID=A0A2H3E4V6_ARMGA|nr:hypothetical protein ARMGADRAFT_588126 [Armillaria gallica]